MLLLENITEDPLQTQTFVLPDGGQVEIVFEYLRLQYGWIMRSMTYEDFSIKGFRICNNPNMLHQWKNILPFGLACITDGNREPTQIDDFSSGASKLYFLTEDEVQQYADFLTSGI